MKVTKKSIRENTTGTKGNYTVKLEVYERQTSYEFTSCDGYLEMITERYQEFGHRDHKTADSCIYTKKQFVDAVKWHLVNTKEVNFI